MSGRRPVTTEEHRAAGNFVDRWAVTHIGRDGLRVLSSSCQARYTFATPEEAEEQAGNLAAANSPARIAEVYGAQAVGTFRASRVECWRMQDGGIGDPRGIYWN